MKLFLRLFATCNDDSGEEKLLERLSHEISVFAESVPLNQGRYWKIPEMYEFTFNLLPANIDLFNEIIDVSSDGWVHMGSGNEYSSVWNITDGKSLFVPEVQWAELQLYEASP
ncbi:hypothetical protein KJI95_16320 [Shewanella sp. JM162201]|uniref:Uncharacterized protein n=1 Tax=Shewanella jiangmenensis TaxID=2837387 RepID=A0ABS5V6J2_9GAMM|nr:hypothetical protein [Shewanella jiangmenensis]MBT1446062.1 hypothetical protein [Shewanella jiangmenensis]